MLVPLSEALVLPISVERANLQSLTRKYATRPHPTLTRKVRTECTYPLRHLPFAAFLTEIEIYQISDSQEERQVNAFHMSFAAPPALPMTGLCDSVCIGKANNKVPIPQHLAPRSIEAKSAKIAKKSRTMSVTGTVRALSSRQKQSHAPHRP